MRFGVSGEVGRSLVRGGRRRGAAPPSGCSASILIEVEFRSGIRLDGVEGERLVEVERGLAVEGSMGLGRSSAGDSAGGWVDRSR